MKGTFIGVPLVNPIGFAERTYINPIDGKNIQGLYPGKTDGTISDLIAYRVFNDIVLKANYFLDCHSGDIHESSVWFFIFYKTADDNEKKSESIARATTLKYISSSVYHGSLGMEAAKRGVAGGLFELGEGDRLQPRESNAIYNGTLNVMRHLEMLEGEIKEIKDQPYTKPNQEVEIWRSSASSYFKTSGLYHTDVKPGDILKKDQVVGTVTNFWGEVIETICSPAFGRVSLIIHNPAVNAGESAISVDY